MNTRTPIRSTFDFLETYGGNIYLKTFDYYVMAKYFPGRSNHAHMKIEVPELIKVPTIHPPWLFQNQDGCSFFLCKSIRPRKFDDKAVASLINWWGSSLDVFKNSLEKLRSIYEKIYVHFICFNCSTLLSAP